MKNLIDSDILNEEAIFGPRGHIDRVSPLVSVDDARVEDFGGRVVIVLLRKGHYEAHPEDQVQMHFCHHFNEILCDVSRYQLI